MYSLVQASLILKKKGLKRDGTRTGYTYLFEPLGMVTSEFNHLYSFLPSKLSIPLYSDSGNNPIRLRYHNPCNAIIHHHLNQYLNFHEKVCSLLKKMSEVT